MQCLRLGHVDLNKLNIIEKKKNTKELTPFVNLLTTEQPRLKKITGKVHIFSNTFCKDFSVSASFF